VWAKEPKTWGRVEFQGGSLTPIEQNRKARTTMPKGDRCRSGRKGGQATVAIPEGELIRRVIKGKAQELKRRITLQATRGGGRGITSKIKNQFKKD